MTNGISTVETKMDQNIHATKIYTVSGQQVSKMQSGNIYVVKTADGKMVKVEPEIYYDQSFKSHSDFSTVGIRIGIGVYL